MHTGREQVRMTSRGTESSVGTLRRDMCADPACARALTRRSSCPGQAGGPSVPRLRVQDWLGLQGLPGVAWYQPGGTRTRSAREYRIDGRQPGYRP